MSPTRETFGNIPPSSQLAFYLLAAVATGVFAYGIWRRWRLWRMGAPIELGRLVAGGWRAVWTKIRPGAKRVWVDAALQKRVRGHGIASVGHIALYIGFLALLVGTTLLELDNILSRIAPGLKFHRGTYYVLYEFTLDALGLLFLAGTLVFLGRRLARPRTLGHRGTDWYVLLSFLAIGITGYMVEALRLIWQQPTGMAAHCSPIGLWLASCFGGISEGQARSSHLILWWVHSFLVFGFIASIPFTRLFHFIAAPLNIFLAPPALGVLAPVTIEDVERDGRVGPTEIRHLNQQQLLSLDACMQCGRCDEVCPAFATDKPLSPQGVIQDLKRLMEETARAGAEAPPLSRIPAETLWSCTACSACVQTCPARVNQLDFILNLRRQLVAEGALSGSAATALRRMQTHGNPWGLPATERAAWARQG